MPQVAMFILRAGVVLSFPSQTVLDLDARSESLF